jgi:phage host-nuclease inhibitor protein Gam
MTLTKDDLQQIAFIINNAVETLVLDIKDLRGEVADLRVELDDKYQQLKQEINDNYKELKQEMNNNYPNLHGEIEKNTKLVGSYVNASVTRDEHDKLKLRVDRLEMANA